MRRSDIPSSPSSSIPRRRSPKRSSCRLLPHGSSPLLVATLSTLAWASSLFQDGCDFARVEGPIVERLTRLQNNSTTTTTTTTTGSIVVPPWLEFGIGAYRSPTRMVPNNRSSQGHKEGATETWKTTFDGSCQLYPPQYLDNAWVTSRAFSFLALVLGGGGTLFVWCSTCFVFGRATWRWTGYELMLGSLCQALAFVWFRTSICHWNTCHLFWGSKADIMAATLWWISGLLIVCCRYPTPRPSWNDDEMRQQEEEEEAALSTTGTDDVRIPSATSTDTPTPTPTLTPATTGLHRDVEENELETLTLPVDGAEMT